MYFKRHQQGCHGDGRTNTSVRPFVTSDKALVLPLRNIRAYLSIFEHIIENIQRIYQLCPIANGQNWLSVRHVLIRQVYSPIRHLWQPWTPMHLNVFIGCGHNIMSHLRCWQCLFPVLFIFLLEIEIF
jgi:hypothetical protein